MITIQENGKTYSIINSREKWIEINGVKYKFPKRVKGHSVSQIDNHIFIDGYEFIGGKFKRTLRALYHLFF
ncbi:MAG: hypothetical protein PUJ51_19840 [Clostridiales bacterium]|nr:hypothetical protein [Clostridiales bacterium]